MQGRFCKLATIASIPSQWCSNVLINNAAASQSNSILNAIDDYNTLTCVRLVERTNQNNYVDIGGSQSGCYAYVGMQGGLSGKAAQELNLGTGCFTHGTIIHELLHALGFWHQQSACDRVNFIMWQNIQADHVDNFNKYDTNTGTDFGVTYDYDSILHYGATAFWSNGLPTIVPTDPNASIGQRTGLSAKDIQKLHAMYGC